MEINTINNVGKAKYIVNWYSGKKHNDGSKFFDMKIFTNKKKRDIFIKELQKNN